MVNLETHHILEMYLIIEIFSSHTISLVRPALKFCCDTIRLCKLKYEDNHILYIIVKLTDFFVLLGDIASVY